MTPGETTEFLSMKGLMADPIWSSFWKQKMPFWQVITQESTLKPLIWPRKDS